jgi:hypothetical protein
MTRHRESRLIEIGDVEALAAKYPDVANDLRSFQQG